MYCAENGKRKQVRWGGIDLREGMMIEEANHERCKYLGTLKGKMYVKMI